MNENKTARIEIRASHSEKDTCIERATSVGLNLSQYGLRAMLNRPMPSITDLSAVAEMRRQGGLLTLISAQQSDEQVKQKLLDTADGIFTQARNVLSANLLLDAIRECDGDELTRNEVLDLAEKVFERIADDR